MKASVINPNIDRDSLPREKNTQSGIVCNIAFKLSTLYKWKNSFAQ